MPRFTLIVYVRPSSVTAGRLSAVFGHEAHRPREVVVGVERIEDRSAHVERVGVVDRLRIEAVLRDRKCDVQRLGHVGGRRRCGGMHGQRCDQQHGNAAEQGQHDASFPRRIDPGFVYCAASAVRQANDAGAHDWRTIGIRDRRYSAAHMRLAPARLASSAASSASSSAAALGGVAAWSIVTLMGWDGTFGAIVAAIIGMVIATGAWAALTSLLRALRPRAMSARTRHRRNRDRLITAYDSATQIAPITRRGSDVRRRRRLRGPARNREPPPHRAGLAHRRDARSDSPTRRSGRATACTSRCGRTSGRTRCITRRTATRRSR